jgi:(p)ppGpp synthase/HD superfamily hydrolase
MFVESATSDDLISTIENEAKLKVDSFIEGAIAMAEEVHAVLKREDNTSSFLETHIWPVTINVIRHYLSANKPLTTLQIVSAILHDVMEDDEKILDLYASQSYGFDAYFNHRFGDYVHNVATTLKVKPLSSFKGSTEEERQTERFHDYCDALSKSDYDVKVIKLADRLNNMRFIAKIPYHEKVKRYIREAEDFYIAFCLLPPKMTDFHGEIRKAHQELKELSNKDEVLVQSTSN